MDFDDLQLKRIKCKSSVEYFQYHIESMWGILSFKKAVQQNREKLLVIFEVRNGFPHKSCRHLTDHWKYDCDTVKLKTTGQRGLCMYVFPHTNHKEFSLF